MSEISRRIKDPSAVLDCGGSEVLAQWSASQLWSWSLVVSGLTGEPLLLNLPGLPAEEEARCTPEPTSGDPEAFPGQMRYIIPPVSSGSVPGLSPGWILI